jgi:hypothetical protein
MMLARKNKKKGLGWIIFLSFIALILIVRLLLPVFILNYINQELDKNEEFDGNIEGISLSILAGEYAIEGITLKEVDSEPEDEPLLQMDRLWVKLDYRAIFRGEVIAEVELDRPVINYISRPEKEEVEEDEEKQDELADLFDEMIPVTIDRIKINNGKMSYRDVTTPLLNLQIYNLNLTATNLTTQPDEDVLLPSTVQATANTTGEGNLNLDMKLNALAENPTFDMNLEVTELQLKAFNEFIKDQGSLDVVGGTFGLHTEIAAKRGFFTGYAKPVIDGLEIRPLDKENTGIFQRIYESAATVIRDILEAPGEEQIATRVPIEGKFDDPDANIWRTIINLLRNAFIEALVPSIDYSINIGNVTEVIQERRDDTN